MSINLCSLTASMPPPSYTIDTLVRLNEKYPKHVFVVIMGGDSLESIQKWKNYKTLLNEYQIYVYKRLQAAVPETIHPHIKLFDAPQMDISASFIRNAVKSGKNIRYFLPAKVWDYIKEMHFYEK